MKPKIILIFQNIQASFRVFYLRLFRYIDKYHEPLKCTCGCKDLEECNKDYMGYLVLEYDCRCKRCGKILNHWAFGSWQNLKYY